MTTKPQPRSRGVYVSIALMVLVIAQIAFFSYVLLDLQRNVSDLQNEQASIKTAIESSERHVGEPVVAI
jgi:hypothetical protein